MVLADVNVLVSAWRADAEHHDSARPWLEGTLNGRQAFAFSESVGAGFLRITTHPAIFRPPSDFPKAQAFLEALTGHPRCVVVRPGPRHWGIFLELCQEADARGNLVSDAYHAALAVEHGCEWVTLDRGFRRFPGLRLRLL